MDKTLNALELRDLLNIRASTDKTWGEHVGIRYAVDDLLITLSSDAQSVTVCDPHTIHRLRRLVASREALAGVPMPMSRVMGINYVDTKILRLSLLELEQTFPRDSGIAEMADYVTAMFNAARRFIARHPQIVITHDILAGTDTDVRVDMYAFVHCDAREGDILKLHQRFYPITSGVMVYGVLYRDGVKLQSIGLPILLTEPTEYHPDVVAAVVSGRATFSFVPDTRIEHTMYVVRSVSDMDDDLPTPGEEFARRLDQLLSVDEDDDDPATDHSHSEELTSSMIILVDSDVFREDDSNA